ncbi:MAG: hypothetical protein QM791_06185 [Ferruginibacter sp.]
MPKKQDHSRDFKKEVTGRFLEALEVLSGEGVTQLEIADITGLQSTNISRLKSDPSRGVGVDPACKLCVYFGFSVIWMFLGEGDERADNKQAGALGSIELSLDKLEPEIANIQKAYNSLKVTVNNFVNNSGPKPLKTAKKKN